jgi:hypothetical protein
MTSPHWPLRRATACALTIAAIGAAAQATALGGTAGRLPMLRTRGTNWVDASGEAVSLRGCNLGNWLLQEMWMHAMGKEGIADQHAFRQPARR